MKKVFAISGHILCASAGKTFASHELLEDLGFDGNYTFHISEIFEDDSDDTESDENKFLLIRNVRKNSSDEWFDETSISKSLLTKIEGYWKVSHDSLVLMNYTDFCHYFS